MAKAGCADLGIIRLITSTCSIRDFTLLSGRCGAIFPLVWPALRPGEEIRLAFKAALVHE